MASEVSFGALPIQRVDIAAADVILMKAYEGGINFFDSARSYTDSEEKLGHGLASVRGKIFLATKTKSETKDGVFRDVETSLSKLKTDYIDIYQLHFVKKCPDPGDTNGAIFALEELKRQGIAKNIGVSAHSLEIARQLLSLGILDTIQYPLSYLSTEDELAFVKECAEADVGFIAMKALAGGLLSSAPAAYAFMNTIPNAVPIYGFQKETEVDELLDCVKKKLEMNDALSAKIEQDRQALGHEFCRGCGYCLPCPSNIPIGTANRIDLFLQRSQVRTYLTDEWNEKIQRIKNCIRCNACVSRCPYGLDIPNQLQMKLRYYQGFRDCWLMN
jgi:predicted aldo/keto reductase-like oxidoreductase